MNDPLDYRCASCNAQPDDPCVWKRPKADNPEFHSIRHAVANGADWKVPDPPDSVEWRRKQHIALHKLGQSHDCARYADLARRLPSNP